jgi:hypothetical protein
MMVMEPIPVRRRQKGIDRVLLPDRVPPHLAAGANALIRLDMRTGGNFLQVDRDGFCAFIAFEGQGAGGFVAHFFLGD